MPQDSDLGRCVFSASVAPGAVGFVVRVVLWGALPISGQDRAVECSATIPELTGDYVAAATHGIVGDFEDWRRSVGCALPRDWRIQLAAAVFEGAVNYRRRVGA